MNKKLDFEQYRGALSHLAFDPLKTKGRRFQEDEELSIYGNVFDPFVLDELKITQGKFFRRLAGKTQVFPPELHANIRNRQVHTYDGVAFVTIAASLLGLNVNLARAGMLGHDIGQTAYGHLGEGIISSLAKKEFSHAVMSVVAAQKIERGGRGLNLSYETLEAMLHHPLGGKEMTISEKIALEASLIMLADKIVYTFSDLSDSFRIGYLNDEKAPMKLIKEFGLNQRERIATAAYSLIKESAENGTLSFNGSDLAQKFFELRNWMYHNVYLRLEGQAYREKRRFQLREISEFFLNSSRFGNYDRFLLLALLTDKEADELAWENRQDEKAGINKGFSEIIFSLNDKAKKINIFDPDLHPEDFKYYKAG